MESRSKNISTPLGAIYHLFPAVFLTFFGPIYILSVSKSDAMNLSFSFHNSTLPHTAISCNVPRPNLRNSKCCVRNCLMSHELGMNPNYLYLSPLSLSLLFSPRDPPSSLPGTILGARHPLTPSQFYNDTHTTYISFQAHIHTATLPLSHCLGRGGV
jgi:hypothetical protein